MLVTETVVVVMMDGDIEERSSSVGTSLFDGAKANRLAGIIEKETGIGAIQLPKLPEHAGTMASDHLAQVKASRP